MKRSKKQWITGIILMLCMISGVLFGNGVSVKADNTTSAEESPVHLSKTATANEDGTYTIQLEAFTTGTVTTTTTVVPADIVLVLDTSGSMGYQMGNDNVAGGTKFSGNTRAAYNAFQNGTKLYCELRFPSNSNYRFGRFREVTAFRRNNYSYEYKYAGSSNWISAGGVQFYTNVDSRLTALKDAVNSFVDSIADKNAAITESAKKNTLEIVTFAYEAEIKQNRISVENSNKNNIKSAVNDLYAYGATRADLGLAKANEELGAKKEGRQQVVIFFTDGQPTKNTEFQLDVANAAITNAKAMKDRDVLVYSIAVFSGADTSDPTNASSDFNSYMHSVSSNYPDAEGGAGNSSPNTWNFGKRAEGQYYFKADSASDLNQIFEGISSSLANPSIQLGTSAVVRDILSTSFALPEGFDEKSNIRVQTANYTGKVDGVRTWDTPSDFKATTNVDKDNKTIDVSGFDYNENYVVDAQGNITNRGKKLIITINNILPDPDGFVEGENVPTNNEKSGLYAKSDAEEAVAYFEIPTARMGLHNFVLDYAKQATLIKKADFYTVLNKIQVINKTSVATDSMEIPGSYGILYKNGSKNATINYEPRSMKWNGMDSFYGYNFPSSNKAVWTQINVIPATSVYYEDTFVSTEGTETKPGVVGISYTGTWELANTKGPNVEVANNEVSGWVESLSDDTKTSDGTEAKTSTAGAKASFTFVGTGFDLYSTTTNTSGSVLVSVTDTKSDETDENGKVKSVTKRLLMDTKSYVEGKEYYQIPTLSFQDLSYGEHEVNLTVTGSKTGRTNFNIDGIRIYNPLGKVAETGNAKANTASTTIANAYKAKHELNAVFTEVRDIITRAETLGNDGSTAGAVFLDGKNNETAVTDGTVKDFETYGPKNEVYLAEGQLVGFRVTGTDANYYVGLKAPQGATQATFTDGEGKTAHRTIESPSDLYYKVAPNKDGYIVIKNTGGNILSITKLRTTTDNLVAEGETAAPTSHLVTFNVASLNSYVELFSSLQAVEYTGNVSTEEALAEEDKATEEALNNQEEVSETEAEEAAEEETTADSENKDNVVIENPVVEEKPAEETQQPTGNNSFIQNFMRQFIGWFRGGRR